MKTLVIALLLLVSSLAYAYPPEVPENFKEFGIQVTCGHNQPGQIFVHIYIHAEQKQFISIINRDTTELILMFINQTRGDHIIHIYINTSSAWKEIDIISPQGQDVLANIFLEDEAKFINQCLNVLN